MENQSTAKQLKPHGIYPFAGFVEKSPDPIYTAVGYALTQWENSQSAALRLLAQVSGTTHNHPSIYAIGTQTNVIQLADMIDFAARRARSFVTEVGGPLPMDDLKLLTGSIRAFNLRRNDIAHGVVAEFRELREFTWVLQPSDTTSRKVTMPEHYQYQWNSAQIREYARHFTELGERCNDLIRVIKQLKFKESLLGNRRRLSAFE